MSQRNKQVDLAPIVEKRPFPEFARWWKMGAEFIHFMSSAILKEWIDLDLSMDLVQDYVDEYTDLVYGRSADPELVNRFLSSRPEGAFYSGEFDGLSYAFYRSAFEALADKYIRAKGALVQARRHFTKGVGVNFFTAIQDHLELRLPGGLVTQSDFNHLQSNIEQLGKFLLEQGYLRDKCLFTFDVYETYAGRQINQAAADFTDNLNHHGIGYALYIMAYPAILPSAVYLYQLFGEAQHHSSRMIEELFGRVGYKASEVDEFNPSHYPSDNVVELWTIRS
jgi:hypothetical protein